MKIAIVSDVHLGTRQYGLRERYEDFLAAFDSIRGAIRGQRVDAVVFGGDLFDSPRPDARSVLAAQRIVKLMKADDPDIGVLGIDGNHDLSDGDWLRIVGINPIGDGSPWRIGDVSVCGVHYRNGRDLVAAIRDMADGGVKTDILVMHFALAEMNGGGNADTGVQELSPLLDRLGVKAVLMGHVHIPDCRKWNGVLYVNPGSTEMKSSNEPQEKFFYVLDTETWTAEPVPIETRKVETVEITSEDDLVRFQSVLEEEAKRMSDGTQEKRPFYQVIADDAIEDAFRRISDAVRYTGAIARIVMRSSKARDLAPVVDRSESLSTLESAIEARFPKESDEAKLTSAMLRSPDPSSIHLIVERYMEGDKSEDGAKTP